MSALQAFDRETVGGEYGLYRLLGVFEFDVGVEASGATYIELALGLGVEVEQDLALQQTRFESECAVHARLLGSREQSLYVAVFQILVLQDGQSRGDAYAVVGAEGGAVGRNPLAVDIGLDRIVLEVELLVVVLLRHHVEVRLHDDALAVLHVLGGGLADVDVMSLVLDMFQTVLGGEVEDITAYLLLVVRGVGYGGYALEMLPDGSRR